MATQTANLHLIKPAATENVSLSVLNQNLDILDAQFASGTWTPKLYDTVNGEDVYRADLPAQPWHKLGSLFLIRLAAANVDISTVTGQMKIKNLPCTAAVGPAAVCLDSVTCVGQADGAAVILRPSVTGSSVTGGVIGTLQMLILGV